MAPIIKTTDIGRGLNPKGAAKEVNGMQRVRPPTMRVAIISIFQVCS